MRYRFVQLVRNRERRRTKKCTRVADRAFPQSKVSWRQPGDFGRYLAIAVRVSRFDMTPDSLHRTDHDPCRWMKQSAWCRYSLLRRLRRWLMRLGYCYVPSNVDPDVFWHLAVKGVPFTFRFFGRNLTIEELEPELANNNQWQEAKQLYRAGDRIWPFVINPDTLGMRLGYIVVRNRNPITGVITLVS